ncbi:hypothetical protein [Aureimonas sp. AU22]|uniref:hypothetical protein n=1 Tax=Aureimonas sp. AU22 TaxID=1638162 RepID=UPI0012E3AD7B|nr:hypothetical protein [Aureimonas sp. AU22]
MPVALVRPVKHPRTTKQQVIKRRPADAMGRAGSKVGGAVAPAGEIVREVVEVVEDDSGKPDISMRIETANIAAIQVTFGRFALTIWDDDAIQQKNME